MVFQQRNGRVDRYGQEEVPDIRYMLTESDNKHIKGDMRIIAILVKKEEQAYNNIGDPALLMGKFNVEEEEAAVAKIIEEGSNPDDLNNIMQQSEEEFNPFDDLLNEMLADDNQQTTEVTTVDDETIFSDIDYLRQAINFLNQKEEHRVTDLDTVSGLDINVTPDILRRLKALVPEEALPEGNTLRLSDDKKFCMEEMRRSMQNNLADTAWPKTQYLWAQHPIMSWVKDKASLLFGRGQAPLVGLPNKIAVGEIIYIVAGSIPNKKSTPLVDEWFGLLYKDGCFAKVLTMQEVLQCTGIGHETIPNINAIGEAELSAASRLLDDVVLEAKKHLQQCFDNYKETMDPLINEEIDKLIGLKGKHEAYQMSLFDTERKAQERQRSVDELFNSFVEWVTDTLTIQNHPYIRIVTVVMGVEQ